MPYRDAANLIGELYEAATGTHDWLAVSRGLCDLLGADGASLSLKLGSDTPHNLLRPCDASETAYTDFYRKVDPIRASANRLLLTENQQVVRMERELVPETEYLQSEFYQDYARHANQRYSIVGPVGDPDRTFLAFFRSDSRPPFSERERDLVTWFIPHLRRALQLQRRLTFDGISAEAGLAALERSRSGFIIVDPTMRILFANQVSIQIAENPSSGLLIRQWGPRPDPGSALLVARHREDNLTLKAFVADVAKSGVGGALRLRTDETKGNFASPLALVVSTVPARLAAHSPGSAIPGIAGGAAMIVVHDLGKPMVPPPAMFRDLFGLSTAEAAVAVALLGGRTAEDVARMRQVSLDTVRSQIRTVLNKSEATSLRDLERIGAMLGSMAGSWKAA